MFRALRPVGNNIKYKTTIFQKELFHPFNSKFYQSGTAALAAAIIAAKKANPEVKSPIVLLPAYACPDLISAVVFAKIQPVLIDFEKNKPWMNLKDIQKNLSNSVIAIIAVNFLGIPERISLIKKLINDTKIVLIEDSAQSLPLNINSDYWQGDIIITSFGRGKPLGLLGGGAVLTKRIELYNHLPIPPTTDPSLLNKLKYRLKLHLYNILTKPFIYYWLIKLPGLEIGKTIYKKLTVLENCHSSILALLTANYNIYQNRIVINKKIHNMLKQFDTSLIIDLPGICNIDLASPLLRYPILVTDEAIRNQLLSVSNQQGLGVSSMYGETLPYIEGIKQDLFSTKDEHIIARDFARHLLTLPTHTDIKDSDLSQIEKLIRSGIFQNAKT